MIELFSALGSMPLPVWAAAFVVIYVVFGMPRRRGGVRR